MHDSSLQHPNQAVDWKNKIGSGLTESPNLQKLICSFLSKRKKKLSGDCTCKYRAGGGYVLIQSRELFLNNGRNITFMMG